MERSINHLVTRLMRLPASDIQPTHPQSNHLHCPTLWVVMIHDFDLLNMALQTLETMTNNSCSVQGISTRPYPEPQCRRHERWRYSSWCWFPPLSRSFRCPPSKRCRCLCTGCSPSQWGTSHSLADLHCHSCLTKRTIKWQSISMYEGSQSYDSFNYQPLCTRVRPPTFL